MGDRMPRSDLPGPKAADKKCAGPFPDVVVGVECPLEEDCAVERGVELGSERPSRELSGDENLI